MPAHLYALHMLHTQREIDRQTDTEKREKQRETGREKTDSQKGRETETHSDRDTQRQR